MKVRIDALTSTRAFAALVVFVFHFGRYVEPLRRALWFFNNGNIAVSYFFVLSGFVLYIAHDKEELRYGSFMKKRLARIAPVYLLALVMYMCVSFFVKGGSVTGDTYKQLAASALFVQAYIPQYALQLNSPAWSLSVEMFFYLLFPFFLFFIRKDSKLFLIFAVVLFVVTQAVFFTFFGRNAGDQVNWCFFMYNPVMHLSQFLLGMAGGHFFMGRAARTHYLVPLSLFFVMVVLLTFRPPWLYYDVGLLAPLFLAFIVSVAFSSPAFLRIRPLVFLGEISYGIYILQMPVWDFSNWLNDKYWKIPEQPFFFIALSFLILFAALVYYLFEKPTRKLILSI